MAKDFACSETYVRRREVLAKFGDVSQALSIVEDHLDRFDDPQVWALYGETLLMAGRETSARAAFRCALGRWPAMHVKDVLDARAGYVVAVVDDHHRVVYVPIPKCSSTTVKGYMNEAMFGQAADLDVHEKLVRVQRILRLEELSTLYREYFRFAIVRPAEHRLNSYYYGNIRRNLLKTDSWERDEFLGLSTSPDQSTFVSNFFAYRQAFPDVRNHTNKLEMYIGKRPTEYFDKIYTMDQIEECRLLLESLYQRPFPAQRKMAAEYSAPPLVLPDPIKEYFQADSDLLAELQAR